MFAIKVKLEFCYKSKMQTKNDDLRNQKKNILEHSSKAFGAISGLQPKPFAFRSLSHLFFFYKNKENEYTKIKFLFLKNL